MYNTLPPEQCLCVGGEQQYTLQGAQLQYEFVCALLQVPGSTPLAQGDEVESVGG